MSFIAKPFVLMWQTLKQFFQVRFFSYLDRKRPATQQHTLNRKNLFVLFTARGYLYIGVNLVLWVLGTNYQNNLVLALAFFMASLLVVSILHTFANLSRISVRSKGVATVFAGSDAEFKFVLRTSRSSAENLRLRFQSRMDAITAVCLLQNNDMEISVPLETQRRGWLPAERLLIESEYPLGLLRCWTWLRFDVQALVFPEPIEVAEPHSISIDEQGEEEHPIKGGEDFSGLQAYTAGDSIKHMAWKIFARGGGLHTKAFSQSVSREIWLDFSVIAGADIEEKLSGLSYWALEYERRQENYGLRLPGTQLAPACGEDHLYTVLSALACFVLE